MFLIGYRDALERVIGCLGLATDCRYSEVQIRARIVGCCRPMVMPTLVVAGATKAVASSYGWGSVPMLNVYRADMEGEDGQLPVLPWNRTL